VREGKEDCFVQLRQNSDEAGCVWPFVIRIPDNIVQSANKICTGERLDVL